MSPGEDPPDASSRKMTGDADRGFRRSSAFAGGAGVDAAIREALGQARQVSTALGQCADRLATAAQQLDSKSRGNGDDRSRAVATNLRNAAEAAKRAQSQISSAKRQAQRRPSTRDGAGGR